MKTLNKQFTPKSLLLEINTKVTQKGFIYLVLLLLLLPAIRPLLTEDFTCGFDNTFHLWRAVQVDALWSQGVFYSRWAPDMAHGFGFPLFVFTSPGASMIAVLIHRIGTSLPLAINLTFVIGMLLGAFFMYNLAEDIFGPSAGLVAALAYAYAPFQAYDVFNRGSLWESFAWAFPPLVLWGVNRWAAHQQRAGLVWGVIGLALMVISHHLFAFLFGPLFAIWVLALAYYHKDWRIVWRGVLLGVLGMGLTCFFWLPPLFERQFIQTDRLIGTWVFDFRYNFITLNHVLALPRFADHRLINDWPAKALGLVPVVMSACAFVRFRKLSGVSKGLIVVLSLMVVVFVVMTLPVSKFVWDNFALLRFVQFPWRFLGPGALCVALLCGAGSASLTKLVQTKINQPWVILVMSAIVIFANLGWFYPKQCTVQDNISIQAMLEWEKITDTLGTTAKGEYLPVWVKQLPTSLPLQEAYKTGETIPRIDPSALPEGTAVVDAFFGATRDVVKFNTVESFRIQWLRFYYPGWRVRIDGLSVPVYPEKGTGLLSFEVPAGEHVVEVRFIETPLRWVADFVSLISLIAFIFISIFNRFQIYTRTTHLVPDLKIAFVFTIIVLGIVFLYADREWSIWRTSLMRGDAAWAGMDHPLNVNFDSKAVLLGLDNLPASLHADETCEITLYWRAVNPGNADWQVGLTLVGPEGKVVRHIPMRPARWSRTPPPLGEWPGNMYARMDFVIEIPAGTSPGEYKLSLKLFDRQSLVPASTLGDSGNPLGPELSVGSIEVKRPHQPFSLTSLNVPEDGLSVSCGPLKLLLMQADRETAVPGDIVAVRWIWETKVQPDQDIRVPLVLNDAAGKEIWVWDQPIIASWWPASLWEAGDRWEGNHILRIPGSAESGVYSISIDESFCDGKASISIEIIAPERNWILPEGYTPVGAILGDRLNLAGYALDEDAVQPGQDLELSLAWQAKIEMENSYRIFVHLTGEDGTILTQNDGVPAQWSRPTSGWAPGEFVIDDRWLKIPPDAKPGKYNITTGAYLDDGTRLLLPDGRDAIQVVLVTIE